MKIKIYCVGSIKEEFYREACAEYLKRISKYSKIEIIEAKDESTKEGLSDSAAEQIRTVECNQIMNKLKANDYVCTLDLNKKEMSSEEFSQQLISMIEKGGSSLSFVIGGSLGLSKDMKSRANNSISFSKMTFPHQLCRVILLEQIYRAFKIYKGEPYHK